MTPHSKLTPLQLSHLDMVVKNIVLYNCHLPGEDTPQSLAQTLGLLGRDGFLSPVGKWLCNQPNMAVWEVNGRLFPKVSPLQSLRRICGELAVKKDFRSRLTEQLGWLLTGSTDGAMSIPSILVTGDGPFEVPRVEIKVSRKHLAWILLEGPRLQISHALQLMGVLQHSSMEEFWHTEKITFAEVEDPKTTETRTLYLSI